MWFRPVSRLGNKAHVYHTMKLWKCNNNLTRQRIIGVRTRHEAPLKKESYLLRYYTKDYMLGTTTKLLTLFQVLGLRLYLKELLLHCNRDYHQKIQKKETKDVGMACQKVYKQGSLAEPDCHMN